MARAGANTDEAERCNMINIEDFLRYEFEQEQIEERERKQEDKLRKAKKASRKQKEIKNEKD